MTSSDKSVDLRRWSESVAKNMEMFKEGAEMMVRDHQKSNVKHISFAIHLKHMSGRETSLPVKTSLETLSAHLDALELERSKVLAQLQALIVNKFERYPGELTVQKSAIETRNKSVRSYAKCHNDYASAKKGGDPGKIESARSRLASEEQFMRSSEDVLNALLGKFELSRVSEMKEFLGRYIQNEIYMHAKAIEHLTTAYGEVAKIDPETEKAIFLRRIREMEFQDVARAQPAGYVMQPQPPQLQSQQSMPMPMASPSSAATQQPMMSPQGGQQQFQQQQQYQSGAPTPMGSP